ncbi:preprotein translocase subunit YajC [Agromyces seonyuensis]|uniref:Preprotein translocase subunit YajC n=1 Tax=Agromyces seonyuensis TaxID=2662446 RepID=A0A6I4NZZ9_9MICO|nr:preprotein translocase subunit YajC [Agromyces seonyuensis]MWB99711.1 preprotein translocase subunit YajC [Agromyces seonyuensis]
MDPFTLIMLAVLAVLIFFMFRNSRKRQHDARELQSKVQPGADVMTNFGLFGTVVSIDDEDNKVVLDLGDGNTATVHRQTVARVVEPTVPAAEETETVEAIEGQPEFGERIESADATPAADADEAPKKND